MASRLVMPSLLQERGIRLFTTHVRRGAPDVQDPSWNSHSKLNCIAACIQVSWGERFRRGAAQ